jgi:3-oxoacyl-[acyl-carrier protein] reductase
VAANGGWAVLVQADITDESSVCHAMAMSGEALGGLHVLVNNAGVLGRRATVQAYPAESWREVLEVLEVNLVGAFLCCKAAVPHLRGAGWSRIVNIASVAAKDGNPMTSPYAASTAGPIALTKSLSKELAQEGILVNAVTPSAPETEIFGTLTAERRAQLLERVPMQRFLDPSEVSALVAWLVSAECSFPQTLRSTCPASAKMSGSASWGPPACRATSKTASSVP